MKTKHQFLILLAAFAVSCSKNSETVNISADAPGKLIGFRIPDALDSQTQTKAVTDITQSTLQSIYVSASSGTPASNETAWSSLSNTEVNLTSGSGVSSVYWPAQGDLSFYATGWSVQKTITTTGASFTLEYSGGDADYVAGYASGVANGTVATIAMKHVLGRLYDIKFKASANSQATITSISVTPENVKGSFSFRDEAWTPISATSSAMVLTPQVTSFSGESVSIGQQNVDHSFIPGNLKITVAYTVQADGYSKSFTKSATVALAQGVKSTVSAVLTDDKSPIGFSVSVEPWQSKQIDTVLE